MTGVVTDELEAVFSVTVLGQYGHRLLKGILDTGFTDFLTLAPEVISALGLTYSHAVEGRLANGDIGRFDAYEAEIDWDGSRMAIVVLAANGGPLIGMSLLRGSLLCIEVVAGGEVYTEPLPNSDANFDKHEEGA